MNKVVEAIDAEIAEANQRRSVVVSEIENRKGALREVEREIASLNRARREVCEDGSGEKKPKRVLEPRTIAGPKALKATVKLMKRVKTATQAQVTKDTGLNSGSVSYALRSLEADGKVRRTGKVVGRSPEWEFVEGGSTVVRPGD